MVLLNDADASAKTYLESTDLLPSLELGLEEMLKQCAAADGEPKDPLNFLASFLMRNNPKHNPVMREKMDAVKAAMFDRAVAEAEEARVARRKAGGPLELKFKTLEGDHSLNIAV